MYLRAVAIIVSLLIHGAIGYKLLPAVEAANSEQAIDMGKGMDIMLVQGEASSDGISKGDAQETREIAEVAAMQAAPPPPPEEKKPDELHDVIASAESSVEQQVVKTEEPPPPDTPPPPPETAQAITQPAQLAVFEVRSSGQSSGGDAKAFGRYMSQINDRVQKAKRNPHIVASGTVVLRYTIGLDGQLLSKEIATSSGSKSLDEAATEALDRAAPFPPIPPEVSAKPLAFTQPFKFIMR